VRAMNRTTCWRTPLAYNVLAFRQMGPRFGVALSAMMSVLPAAQGCSASSSTAPTAPISCSSPSIELSNYDQSCARDSDCVAIGVGPACVPCDLSCPNAAVNVAAHGKYLADVAMTPAASITGCTVSCALAVVGPCCSGGKCHAGSICSGAVSGDASAETE
jgi:hypothetical protein